MRKSTTKSVLSLDIGRKRIGIAGCDPLGLTITHLPAIFRTNLKDDLIQIQEVCIKREVIGIIIGLPLDDNGKETYQSKYSKKEGLKIAKSLHLPFVFINEHSSTWEAKNKFKLTKDKSGRLDSASAAILLQQWLREGPDLKASI